MNRMWMGLVLAVVLSSGCGGRTEKPLELQVGKHHLQMVLPQGWEHIDYGDRHQLRKDLARISIEPLGWAYDDLDRAVTTALRRLKEDDRRDEASRTRIELNGHEVVLVDTWDRVSHQYRKRFFFLRADRDLLSIYMQMGRFEEMEADFDDLVASVALVDSLPPSSPGVGKGQPE